MPIIINPESREEWLQLKTEDISSTEVSALYGLSPYSTEFELFHMKQSGEIQELDDNERMFWGRMIEDTIANGVAEKLGLKVRRLKTYMRHSETKRMGSSFDYEIVGIVDENGIKLACTPEEAKNAAQRAYLEKGAGILEIKNVDNLVYRDKWEDDEAPTHIETQVQHQLEVVNRDWCIIAALVGGNTLKLIHRDRNPRVGEAIRKRIDKFWADIIAVNIPKPNYELDAGFIIDLYSNADGDVFDATERPEIVELVRDYKQLRDTYNQTDKASKAIKAQIFEAVGNAPKIICPEGLTVTTTKTKDTPPTEITEDMVGEVYGGRKGYRQCRISQKKIKPE